MLGHPDRYQRHRFWLELLVQVVLAAVGVALVAGF